MHPKLKLVLVVLGKLAFLYLMTVIISITVILLQVALPRIVFETEPLLHAAALVLLIAAGIALKTKSRTPLLWAIFCLGYSSLYIDFYGYLEVFIIVLSIAAGINYIYRNRITEPLLVLLPVLTGGWLFLQLIYMPYAMIWITMKTGYDISFGIEQIWTSLLISPLILMYLLGKRYYKDIYLFLKRRAQPSNH
jgi:hypothetical protein